MLRWPSQKKSWLPMQEKKESPLENFFGESSEASEAIREGDRVRVNLTTGEIFDLTQKKKFFAKPIPTFMQDLIRDGGLIRHLRKKRFKGKT